MLFFIVILVLIFIMICTVIFSANVYAAAHSGFMLWVNNVIPSLLPFFICIEILKKTNVVDYIRKIFDSDNDATF